MATACVPLSCQCNLRSQALFVYTLLMPDLVCHRCHAYGQRRLRNFRSCTSLWFSDSIHQSSIPGAALFRPLTWSERKLDTLKSCHVSPDLLMTTNEPSLVQGVDLQHKSISAPCTGSRVQSSKTLWQGRILYAFYAQHQCEACVRRLMSPGSG